MATDEQVAPKKNYGQNGYTGASSDLPGESTSSGFYAGGPTQDDLTQALERVSPKEGRDTVRDRSGKGNPPAPKDFKQPKFASPQTREVSADAYPLSFGMDSRSPRNR